MALIKCPECGREVSVAAKSCPQCGYPIAENNPVGEAIIKINLQGYWLNVVIYDEHDRESWRGKTGNVVRIPVDGPKTISLKGRSISRTVATVRAGEKYEFTGEDGFLGPRDTFRRVDVIDSGR